MITKFKYLLMATALIFCLCQSASAELSGVSITNNPFNGFPFWYTDGSGTALELCLDPTYCVFDPVSGSPFSVAIGFGEKAFYWSADATLSGGGANGNLQMGLVASFSGSTTGPIPAVGEQIVFFEIVVGPISGLIPGGVYTVTHPYGVLTNLVANSLGIIPVQIQTFGCTSQPCDFTEVLKSPVGLFLKWNIGAPVGFIGNPKTSHTVVGSPFGTNFFRVDGLNAGGLGGDTKLTNLFNVQGKIFIGTLPTPLVVDRTTYTRPWPSAVNVSGTTAPNTVVQVSGTEISTVTKVADADGNFFAHIPLAGDTPGFVTVTANGTTAIQREVIDVVTITSAEYNSDLKILTIEAFSSDQTSPGPTLTAVGFVPDLTKIPGVFPNKTVGKKAFTNILVPPTEVTVLSSAGGSDTAKVTITANIKPIARNDTAPALKDTPTNPIDVLENDTAVSGELGTVNITTQGAHGTAVADASGKVVYTPAPGYVGKDSFKYTVDGVTFVDGVPYPGLTSNPATVNITVAASETLTVTKASFTTGSSWWQISGKSTVKSGNEITLYVGPNTSGEVIGTATVNVFGTWTFSKLHSLVAPGGATSITAQSSLGTTVTFSLTVK